jgi:hypothetical protein
VTRRRVIATAIAVGVITLVCAVLIGAAALAPAPVEVLPLVIVACLGCPMLAVFELAGSLADFRGARTGEHEALAKLRHQLRRLPETEHPLGL